MTAFVGIVMFPQGEYDRPEVAVSPLNAEINATSGLDHLFPNYGERKITLVRGEGTSVWDSNGKQYLDFLSGISVNNLGHCPDVVVKALTEQAAKLMHCSNLYLIPSQVELAGKLTDLCFADKAFFANSGAEANEAAIKLARLFSKTQHGDNRYEIITMKNSFHGRTLATIAATGQEKIQKGFEPLPMGFVYADFNDLDSVKAAISDKTCAIMLEPVQGEGGVTPATQEFMSSLRELCNEKNLLLIFDEIQCGMARCGKMFAHQIYGVEPDIMTLAKALGNGYPISAMLARDAVADVLKPGTHGTTFGGNPMGCAVGTAIVDYMTEHAIAERAGQMGEYFKQVLKEQLGSLSVLKEIRGHGLMIGIELTIPGADIVKECADKGILINCTMVNVLRILPPLTCTREECDRVAIELKSIISGVMDKEVSNG